MTKKAKAKPASRRTSRATKSEIINPKVELVARRGSELAAKGDYFGALAHFEKVLSVDPRHLYALYGAANCRGTLMEHLRSHDRDAAIDGILALCHRMILRTPELSLSPTAKEDLFPRETLRYAYNELASWQMERAKTKRDLETALGHIDHCLSLTSPLDDKNALLRYLHTKVRILLRIGRKEEAFEIVTHSPKYSEFADVVRGTEYQSWMRRGAIKAERKSRRSLEER